MENIAQKISEPTDQQLDLYRRSASTTVKHRVVSLFSGCGGMDLGFQGGFKFLGKIYRKHPFSIVWANELNAAACRTYRRNIDADILEGDVWNHLPSLPKSAEVVIGGFPCQDISINGKGAGIKGARSGLYRAMVQAVDSIKPSVFIAENVKGLLMKPHRESLEKVISDFSSLGYDVRVDLYHAADYGVPQSRDRVLIVGTRKSKNLKFLPPSATHIDAHITAEDAIGDLESKRHDESINHIWSKANKSPDQGSRKLKADRPGYTIRAECHGNIQWHYSLPRRISMREAARIQSFPDKFIFDSKLRETERQVGNAVPPVFAWHIAKSVRNCLEQTNL